MSDQPRQNIPGNDADSSFSLENLKFNLDGGKYPLHFNSCNKNCESELSIPVPDNVKVSIVFDNKGR